MNTLLKQVNNSENRELIKMYIKVYQMLSNANYLLINRRITGPKPIKLVSNRWYYLPSGNKHNIADKQRDNSIKNYERNITKSKQGTS